MPPHLRLAAENGNPVKEEWSDIPDHTLVTISLPRKTVDGLWHGYGNLMEAFSHMLAAMHAAKAEDDARVAVEFDRAMGCVALASAFAADVYRRVREEAVRTNRRKPGRRTPR